MQLDNDWPIIATISIKLPGGWICLYSQWFCVCFDRRAYRFRSISKFRARCRRILGSCVTVSTSLKESNGIWYGMLSVGCMAHNRRTSELHNPWGHMGIWIERLWNVEKTHVCCEQCRAFFFFFGNTVCRICSALPANVLPFLHWIQFCYLKHRAIDARNAEVASGVARWCLFGWWLLFSWRFFVVCGNCDLNREWFLFDWGIFVFRVISYLLYV